MKDHRATGLTSYRIPTRLSSCIQPTHHFFLRRPNVQEEIVS
jgi:hypothetical protein